MLYHLFGEIFALIVSSCINSKYVRGNETQKHPVYREGSALLREIGLAGRASTYLLHAIYKHQRWRELDGMSGMVVDVWLPHTATADVVSDNSDITAKPTNIKGINGGDNSISSDLNWRPSDCLMYTHLPSKGATFSH